MGIFRTCAKCGSMYVGEVCATCAAGPAEEAPALQPGRSFHGFEIVEVLGQGGMGVVYKARQTSLGRPVALKVLSGEKALDAEFAARFDREARTLASLSHPNIVACYDFGIEGDSYFLAMEYVDGFTLRRILDGRRLSVDESLKAAAQICDALDYAHGRGVVHRDIKPENILVDPKGRVKVADFGLAKLIGPSTGEMTLTATGAAVGTPRYMAPEQVQNAKLVDPRADIYSAGVVLYEMLTGETPLGRSGFPAGGAPVHPLLEAAIMKAVTKDPARRHAGAAEFKAALLRKF